jgi:hypothetical protein
MTTPAPQFNFDNRSVLPINQTDDTAASFAAFIDSEREDALPTSFGVFKPVGHVMVGLPTQSQLNSLVVALHSAGWPLVAMRQISHSVDEMQAMLDNAGLMAGFGYEIQLLRHYMDLTEAGYFWLLVKADDMEHATAAAEVARGCGAALANYYRTLTVEELIA